MSDEHGIRSGASKANGMPDKSDVPALDLSAIFFPTDSVTIGHMRRLKPELFRRLTDVSLFDLGLAGAIAVETTLAEKAFVRAIPAPDLNEESREELIEMLNVDYCEWGLSSGLNQTRELVRTFEIAAAAQARTPRGRAR